MSGRGWVAAGSVLFAVASSACCWLPFLMIATGVSAFGAAAFFEQYRLLFLAGAVLLLAFGFYLNYRPARKEVCAGEQCVTPNRRLQRFNRAMLWSSAVLVLAFSLFPNYIGRVAGSEPARAHADSSKELVLAIEGMTCTGCEAGVSAALASVPGVREVSASFEKGEAVVTVDSDVAPDRIALAAAVGSAGYALTTVAAGENDDSTKVAAREGADRATLAGQWIIDLPLDDGETTHLVVDIGPFAGRWVGEFDLLDYRVENYPVKISFDADQVTLYLTAIGMEFRGSVNEDGSELTGVGVTGDEEETITFTRAHEEPQFSADFLALEAAADDPSLVTILSTGAPELRDRFNAEKKNTRLIALLSPT